MVKPKVKDRTERFPRSHRVVRRVDYRGIYGAGHKLHSGNFVLFGRVNTLDHHRLGVTASRKVGGAVARNRAKRLFREVFRRCRAEIPHHFDFVVNAKRECLAASYDELRREFVAAALRIIAKQEARQAAPQRGSSDEDRNRVDPAGV